ncbi:alpha-1-antitrypsin-like [Elgaria multicarinata webbii]|uniref:alpha-1-antitrypsin-like n=1 Tax=Elgaria multicarinata webbii TaxID=159646 RepID=UPI002FCD4176
MKYIYFFTLLIVIQVYSHHVPGHHNEPENDKDKIIFEDQLPFLEEEHRNKARGYDMIAPYNANFAFSFYRQIVSAAKGKNVLFSPPSISTAFALLTLGAKSETQSQIYKGLAFNLSVIEENEIHKSFHQLIQVLNQPSNKAHVSLGNALFIMESLKILPKFLDNAKTLYEAEAFSCNFNDSAAAEKQINDYVQNKTHGKIARAVEGLDPSTVMVVVSYIFFNAHWENAFDTDLTTEEDFFIDADTTVKVHMMHRQGNYNFLRDDDLSCWVVEVPYKGDASALFILPDVGKMEHAEGTLGIETLAKWKTSFTYEEIHLYIPKFSISASYDVKDILQRLGVTDAFSDNADLSGITGQRDLKVSKAVHKTVLEVHESGTEAAAVTVIEISPRFAGPSTTIKLNTPFQMLIINKPTHTILFAGKVINPTES